MCKFIAINQRSAPNHRSMVTMLVFSASDQKSEDFIERTMERSKLIELHLSNESKDGAGAEEKALETELTFLGYKMLDLPSSACIMCCGP